jgi:signal transduction histidine kinase
VITQLAIENQASITTQEFKTLNGCLDDAIAQAVTEYSRVRERSMLNEEVQRLGFLAHELRNSLQAASISYDILRTGTVAIGGSTGAVLGRSLATLRALVDRTLAQVRLDAGVHHKERVGIAAFLEEIEATGSMLAKERSLSLSVDRGDIDVAVDADPQLLGSAVSNLVHNAIKFTHTHGHVLLRTSATADHVVIEVEDECGGLLEEQQIAELFEGFHQAGEDKSGLGLGLLISKRSVEAMGGSVRARNTPHVGCVFTIELPRSGTSDHRRRRTDVR